jgi:hypothetical protein
MGLLRRALLGVSMAASCAAANAGIIYNWVTLTAPTLHPELQMFGTMVFDDSWWAPGKTFLYTSGGGLYPPTPEGLLSFSWGETQAGVPGSTSFADYQPFICSAPHECADPLYGVEGKYIAHIGTYDIAVVTGILLTGYASINDTQQNVSMSSWGPLWTVSTFRTDGPGPGPCFLGDFCGGGTGLWVLDLNSVPTHTLPEPATLSLMLAGGVSLIGVAVARRRRWVIRSTSSLLRC